MPYCWIHVSLRQWVFCILEENPKLVMASAWGHPSTSSSGSFVLITIRRPPLEVAVQLGGWLPMMRIGLSEISLGPISARSAMRRIGFMYIKGKDASSTSVRLPLIRMAEKIAKKNNMHDLHADVCTPRRGELLHTNSLFDEIASRHYAMRPTCALTKSVGTPVACKET